MSLDISEKTNMMQSLMELFRSSRLAHLDLSECVVQLNCNLRQFALYFELEEQGVARSLWRHIHDDKIVAHSLKHLNLSSLKMFINQRQLLVHQELSVLECDNLEYLNLSNKQLETSKSDHIIFNLLNILENIPSSCLSSLQTLLLENHCLYQMVPANTISELKDCLLQLVNLTSLSLAGSWFVPDTAGKEEVMKMCVEMLPRIETLSVRRCHLDKETGARLSSVIKNKVKKMINHNMMKVDLAECAGEGVEKMISMIDQSKHVIATMDQQSGVLTVERV